MKLFFSNGNLADKKVEKVINKVTFLYEERYYRGARDLVNNTSIELLVVALEKIDDILVINFFLTVSQNIKLEKLFLSFSIDNQIKIVDTIEAILLKKLINELNSDDVVQLLEHLDTSLYKRVMLTATPELRAEIKQINRFEQGKAGSIMNTTVLFLQDKSTVAEALSYLKAKRGEFDIEEEIFVVDAASRVVGILKIQDLFFWENTSQIVGDLGEKSVVTIQADEDIDDAITVFQKYNLNILAVVNQEEKLLGVITNNDIIPEIMEENIDDLNKLHGIYGSKTSYTRSTISEIVESRILWLVILLFATTITTFVIHKFEVLGYEWTAGISSAILVPIIPFITDMSGNCGSQTASTIIQAFAAKEISEDDFYKIVKKEFYVAAIIGAILSSFNFIRLIIYYFLFPIAQNKIAFQAMSGSGIGDIDFSVLSAFSYEFFSGTPALSTTTQLSAGQLRALGTLGAFTSSLALFIVVIVSKVLGVLVPYAALKKDLDPATFSTPALTTILDTLSVVIFFGLSIAIFKLMVPLITNKTITGGKLSTVVSSAGHTVASIKEFWHTEAYLPHFPTNNFHI